MKARAATKAAQQICLPSNSVLDAIDQIIAAEKALNEALRFVDRGHPHGEKCESCIAPEDMRNIRAAQNLLTGYIRKANWVRA